MAVELEHFDIQGSFADSLLNHSSWGFRSETWGRRGFEPGVYLQQVAAHGQFYNLEDSGRAKGIAWGQELTLGVAADRLAPLDRVFAAKNSC